MGQTLSGIARFTRFTPRFRLPPRQRRFDVVNRVILVALKKRAATGSATLLVGMLHSLSASKQGTPNPGPGSAPHAAVLPPESILYKLDG